MKQNLKHLASMALCCVPMLVAPLLLGVAGVLGWRTGVFGVVLTTMAVLACPVSMGLMMWQMTRHSPSASVVESPATGAKAIHPMAPIASPESRVTSTTAN